MLFILTVIELYSREEIVEEKAACGSSPCSRVQQYFMNKVICNFAQFCHARFISTEHDKHWEEKHFLFSGIVPNVEDPETQCNKEEHNSVNTGTELARWRRYCFYWTILEVLQKEQLLCMNNTALLYSFINSLLKATKIYRFRRRVKRSSFTEDPWRTGSTVEEKYLFWIYKRKTWGVPSRPRPKQLKKQTQQLEETSGISWN